MTPDQKIHARIMMVALLIGIALVAWASWASYTDIQACKAHGGVILDQTCVSQNVVIK